MLGNLKIFAGNSNMKLAQDIVQILGVPLGRCEVGTFSDDEISVTIDETVRGCDVFVIQSTCYPVNSHIMELLIMIDAFKRASAGSVTAVIPYFGYARQDRKAKARDPISAKLVADIIETSGVDRVLTMDLHAPQIQGFFKKPVDHLMGIPILARYYLEKYADSLEDVVVVSPDLGSVVRARTLAHKMGCPLAIIDKRRPKPNVAEIMNIIGEVKNKKAILVDDMIDTAGTLSAGAEALLSGGALAIDACCTHGVLSGPALTRLTKSPIQEIVVLDTIPVCEEKMLDKIKLLSVAPVFSEAIKRIYNHMPVSVLFNY